MPPRTRQQTAPPSSSSRTTALQTPEKTATKRAATRSTTSSRRTTRSLSVQLAERERSADISTTASPTPVLDPESDTEDTTIVTGSATPDQVEEDEMLHSHRTEQHGLRERNIEDLAELEEKGLLRSLSPSDQEDGIPTPRRKGNDDEKQRHLSLERTFERSGSVESEEGSGLSSPRDRRAFAVLVLLYLLQGIPLGLTFGTLPFLLKPKLSYSQLGVFSLATWPYSLKLLWSPIVDAWFVRKWGRRKSWIVPVQAVVGLGLWLIGGRIEDWLADDVVDVHFITTVFMCLILAAATQDIAVDGWALTLLSQQNLSYASTAQTIGIGIGNALSFTVFLAFNSVEFSNKYFRSSPLDYGLVSLGGYIRFWGIVFIAATIGIAIWTREDPVSEDDPDMDVKKVYKIMWSIFRLKNIQSLLIVHLTCKLGFQVNDSVTGLKLLEKGLSKEDLAIAVLLDFPAQMIAGWLVAKWSRPTSSKHPLTAGTGSLLKPWVYAFWARLGMALVATAVVYGFPKSGNVGTGYLAMVIMTTLLSSLTSTIQFIGICAFHTHIADPRVGGSSMTLLNTVSNLGGTLPKPIILRLVDLFTKYGCSIGNRIDRHLALSDCNAGHGSKLCEAQGGYCVITTDGYYIMSFVCVLIGGTLLIKLIIPTVRRLEAQPMSSWRVKIPL